MALSTDDMNQQIAAIRDACENAKTHVNSSWFNFTDSAPQIHLLEVTETVGLDGLKNLAAEVAAGTKSDKDFVDLANVLRSNINSAMKDTDDFTPLKAIEYTATQTIADIKKDLPVVGFALGGVSVIAVIAVGFYVYWRFFTK